MGWVVGVSEQVEPQPFDPESTVLTSRPNRQIFVQLKLAKGNHI